MYSPYVTALCPTFRHPELMANSLALWLAQDYPKDRRHLLIMDDGGTFYPQSDPEFQWSLHVSKTRFPSLPAKYNKLLELVPKETEIILIWEDDDIYLSSYVSTHVKALEHCELSKTRVGYTDCGPNGSLQLETIRGKCHSSTGFRKSLIDRIGGWVDTKKANFDLQLIHLLTKHTDALDEWEDIIDTGKIPYVYCWHTGQAHCQWTMKSPDDETWYDEAEAKYSDKRYIGKLRPKLNSKTKKVLEQLQ